MYTEYIYSNEAKLLLVVDGRLFFMQICILLVVDGRLFFMQICMLLMEDYSLCKYVYMHIFIGMAKESEAITLCGVLRVCFVFRSQSE